MTYSNIFIIFPRKQVLKFMQIVSTGENLHEILNPFFFGKIIEKRSINDLLSAELG